MGNVEASWLGKLSGTDAFYYSSSYVESERRALCKEEPPEPCYRYDTMSSWKRTAIATGRIVAFPLVIYRWWHILIGKLFIIPAASPRLVGLQSDYAQRLRKEIPPEEGKWRAKRLSVAVDGKRIDGAILGTTETFGNGRWILLSQGNAQFYEESLGYDAALRKLADRLGASLLVYNYPGVGASDGTPNRTDLSKAQRAMMSFLADPKGLAAKEVLLYGHSIGGGIQAAALAEEPPPSHVRWTLLSGRTFDSVANLTEHIVGSVASFLIRLSGWNLDVAAVSQQTPLRQYVLQSCSERHRYSDLSSEGVRVVHDGIIPAQATLARALLASGRRWPNKVFIGAPEGHNESFSDPVALAELLIEKGVWAS